MPLATAILLAVVALAMPTAAIHADEPPAVGKIAGLEDRLKTGLRARRPEEHRFIERVVLLVREGSLPGTLVDSTYLWAIERQKKYPYPLFERALRIQADRLGVDL
ncbi:MAG: hypothetical protein ACK52C_11840 [Planctomycetia bacterium]|jgi:hypothetical protein